MLLAVVVGAALVVSLGSKQTRAFSREATAQDTQNSIQFRSILA